jgi:hypothetical protein
MHAPRKPKWDDERYAVEMLVQFHLAFWTIGCIGAFVMYYCFAEVRSNPDFQDQMHCLSGVILFNRPLFGTLLCGFGGAIFMAAAERVHESPLAMVCLILMFVALVVVVNYDVCAHKSVHFSALGLLMVSGTAFLLCVGLESEYMRYLYFSSTILFVLVLILNVLVTRWAPPFMTVQAITEIVWVGVFAVAVLAFALGR